MNDVMKNSMFGALVADAVSMPVHWYYDTDALDRDYPDLARFQSPRNPHPDSILWRSKYVPRNKEADILHEQASYWGQRGVHYHQFLQAGDNTLNFLLGIQLYRLISNAGYYDQEAWLHLYVHYMRTPGLHQDTYVEEYHRAFFDNLAQGKPAHACGIQDIHIGGLTSVPFLLAGLNEGEKLDTVSVLNLVTNHLALTHHGQAIASAGRTFVEILQALSDGHSLRSAIKIYAVRWVSAGELDTWISMNDRTVVGRHLTSACYLPESFTAALYLAWKYHDDFSAGVVANAACGGDNAHRGAVVGALLGAANGVPWRWQSGLKSVAQLCLEPEFTASS